jgi:ATP-dependent RNA helicase DeaD
MKSDTCDREERSDVTDISEEQVPSFGDFGLREEVLRAIDEAGFDKPTPIQTAAIGSVLAGRDMIGQAQTGSGKTAAFVIPAIQALKFNRTVEVLVLVPTRELCKQVVTEFERLGKYRRANIVSVVGGESGYRQIELVNRGAQVIVATPGRMLDQLSESRFKNFKPSLVVLDEADEMLDMGFIEDIRKILAFAPTERQTLLFSATMPPPIARLAQEHLKNPEHIKLVSSEPGHQDIEQFLYMVKHQEREQSLVRLIDSENPKKAVVFCRTKKDTAELCDRLAKRGVKAQPLHGDLSQNERVRAINQIKNGYARVLVATDVASRGLDIPDLTHVFNFHAPEDRSRYTHRIGRTGRAGSQGRAMTLVTPAELRDRRYLTDSQANDVKLASIPRKANLERQLDLEFFEKLEKVTPSKTARSACEEFSKEDALDLAARLYTYIRAEENVSGPDILGFTPDDIEKLQKTMVRGAGRGGRRGGPGGFRSGRGGSGGRDFKRKPRSGGGRPGGGPSGGSASSGGGSSSNNRKRFTGKKR